MPGYTCMVVPSAVQFAGLKPAYVDIDPETYNLDPRQLERPRRHKRFCTDCATHLWHSVRDDAARAMGSVAEYSRDRRLLPLLRLDLSGAVCAGRSAASPSCRDNGTSPSRLVSGGMLLVNDPGLADSVEQNSSGRARRARADQGTHAPWRRSWRIRLSCGQPRPCESPRFTAA